MRDALALAILVPTIVAIVTRPRGLNEAVACLTGAALMTFAGVVGPHNAYRAVGDQWNVLLFFIGLLTTIWASEEAGFIRWAALWAARLSRGSARRLFFNTVITGVALTTLLSNDATALLLTTVIVVVAEELQLPPLPYAFACAFIANSASMMLPISNPLNILVLGSGDVRLASYVTHMLPAGAAVVGLTTILIYLGFRGELSGRFDPGLLPNPSSAIERRSQFVVTCVVLLLLAVAYVVASARGWPLSLPAIAAGSLLLFATTALARDQMRTIARAPWSIVPFVAGLLVLVRGVESTGLTHELGVWLVALERQGTVAGVLGATGICAIGSNVLNNLPMGAVMRSALRTSGASGHPGLLYGTFLGADVGPNLTVFGSLSSMLWLMLLRRRGLQLTAWQFARRGLVITPILLLAGGAIIALAG